AGKAVKQSESCSVCFEREDRAVTEESPSRRSPIDVAASVEQKSGVGDLRRLRETVENRKARRRGGIGPADRRRKQHDEAGERGQSEPPGARRDEAIERSAPGSDGSKKMPRRRGIFHVPPAQFGRNHVVYLGGEYSSPVFPPTRLKPSRTTFVLDGD